MGRALRHPGRDGLSERHTRARHPSNSLPRTGRPGKRRHGFANPPLLRDSTVLYPTVAAPRAMTVRRGERVLT
jgi:hypothetical protein